MIHGTYTICNHFAHVLIDTSVSHTFTLNLKVLLEKLNSVLFVFTPGSRTLLEEVIYKSCIINIIDRKYSVDLIEIDTRDFDVILEMDWLAAYYATVDYFHKKLVFNPNNKELFTN